jgi:hypothetical protein
VRRFGPMQMQGRERTSEHAGRAQFVQERKPRADDEPGNQKKKTEKKEACLLAWLVTMGWLSVHITHVRLNLFPAFSRIRTCTNTHYTHVER